MTELVILITPGFIASLYYCKQKGIPLKSIDFFVFALIYAFLIHLFIGGIMYLRGHKDVVSTEMISLIGNAFRYELIGLILSFAFPSIVILLEKVFVGKKK